MLYEVLLTIGIWIMGAACVKIMKKIEPWNKIYPAWVLFVTLAVMVQVISNFIINSFDNLFGITAFASQVLARVTLVLRA